MSKLVNDKYYTPPEIVEKTIQILLRYFPLDQITEIIEPSAGDGAFIPGIKKLNKPYKFFDLHPEHPDIVKQDFKDLKLPYQKGRVFLGNPPFGNASSLFRRFRNGGCEMGDGCVYVSPASHWNMKYGLKGMRLVYSEHLGDVEYIGTENKKVNTCLNVYMRGEEESEDRMERLEQDFEITGRLAKDAPSDADFFLRCVASGARKHCGQWDPDRRYSVATAIKVLNPLMFV